MFANHKNYEQIKFSIFFILIIADNNNVMEAAKHQITIGQYFFPRIAFFPDYANMHLLTDPIYNEILLLSQSKQQQQQQQQQQHQQQQQQQQLQQQQQQQRQSMNEQDKAQLYPIPARIFYKNRFKSMTDRISDQQSLFYDKKTSQYIIRDDKNKTHILIPHDEMITNINSDDIHGAVIDKIPISILSQDQSYHYDGFAGHITIDLTDDDSNKPTNAESIGLSQKLQKNSKFPNFIIDDKNEFHSKAFMDQSNRRFFRSNTEIFNQILKIRKDLDGIRRDIRKIKEFTQYVNLSISKYEKNTDTTKYFDKITLISNFTDSNFRSDQVFNNFSSKRNIYTVTVRPTYAAFPRTAGIINPILMSRLQANVAAPALKEDKLRIYDNLINSTKLPIQEVLDQKKSFLTRENIVGSSHRRLLISPIRNHSRENQNLLIANKSSDMIKLNSLISFAYKCDENGKIREKSIIHNDKIKNDTVKSKEQEISQLQLKTTSAKFQLYITSLSSSNEKELPNISVTKAYQPFSTTRYTARSKINFDKRQIDKLINFNTSKLRTVTHQLQNPASIKLASDYIFLRATVSPPHLLSSTKNTLSFENGNNSSHDIILNFASPTTSKSSSQATVTEAPFLSLSKKISNITAAIITNITPNNTAITNSTNPTNLISTTSTSITTTVIPSTFKSVGRAIIGREKIKMTRYNSNTVPPLIPLKPNFFGSNFDGVFVPWFNDAKLTLWPEGLFRRG